MFRREIIKNPAYFAIVVFVGVYFLIIYGYPSMMFEEDGGIRQFGIGFRKKTIFPIWLLAIILGILSYLFVQYFCYHPRLML